LGHNKEVSVRVHRRSLAHALVGQESVDSKALAQCWVTRPRDSLESGNKVDIAIGGNVKGQPSELSG
jgi:hypothetical protein